MTFRALTDSIHEDVNQQGWIAAMAPTLPEDDHRMILLICITKEPTGPLDEYVDIDLTKEGVTIKKLAYVFIFNAAFGSSSSSGWRLTDIPEEPLERECVDRLIVGSVDVTGHLLRKGAAEHLWWGWFSQDYSAVRAGNLHSVPE